jgi:hypothetical protein
VKPAASTAPKMTDAEARAAIARDAAWLADRRARGYGPPLDALPDGKPLQADVTDAAAEFTD